jgi:hypothetical protein
MTHRRGTLIALVAALLLGLMLWLFAGHAKAPARHAGKLAAPAVRPAPAALPSALPARESPEASMEHPPAAVVGRPLIESVEVYPPHPCAHQPIVVTIHAKDPGGRDNTVVTGVGSERGDPLVTDAGVAGKRWLNVQAFNLSGDYDQRPIPITVYDCAAEDEPLRVQAFALGTTPSAVAFTATLPEWAKKSGGTWSYDWNFGDDRSQTTSKPTADHDYGDRDQLSTMSTFVVQVVAHGSEGAEVKGMVGVPFFNTYAINREQKGLIVPEIVVDSAVLVDGAAVIEATVRSWEKAPLDVAQVKATTVGCANDAQPSPSADVPLTALSTRKLAPGRSKLRIQLPAALIGASCNVQLELRGPGLSGMPMLGYLGAGLREREARLTINEEEADEAQVRYLDRLKKAAKLLKRMPGPDGQLKITDAEMQRLEREGAFADGP